MEKAKISEAEWEVMNAVWKSGALTSRDIVEQVHARKGWDSSTIRTLVRRLVNKGALEIQSDSKPQCFEAKMSFDEFIEAEGRTFIERGFGGKPEAMLLHFVEQTKLTPEDIRKFKQILTRKAK